MNPDIEIEEKFMNHGRWYVTLTEAFLGRRTMPLAHFVWLKGNPAFLDIPQGYVIHHLDIDEANDDISNLALMQKHHHTAYHLKLRTIKTKVMLAKGVASRRTTFYPLSEPRIFQRKDSGKYYLSFSERTEKGTKTTNLMSWEGKTLISREMAEKAKSMIWGNAQ